MARVVVTGMAGVTALGDNWEAIESRLRSGQNAVRRMPEWDYFDTLNTPESIVTEEMIDDEKL